MIRWTNRIVVLMVAMGLVAYGVYWAQWGIVPSDEGRELSVPIQYLHGDLPLVVDAQSIGRTTGVLWWPLFEMHPGMTLLQMRYISQAAMFLTLLVWFLIWRRFVPPGLSALMVATWAFMATGPYRTATYDWNGVNFALMGGGVWILMTLSHSRGKAVLFGFIAIASILMGCISYWPFSCTVALIPLLLLATGGLSIKDYKASWPRVSWFVFGATAAIVGSLVLFLLLGPIRDNLREGISLFRGYPVYVEDNSILSLSRARLYAWWLRELSPRWFSFAGVGFLIVFAVRSYHQRRSSAILALALALWLCWSLLAADHDFHLYERIYLFNAAIGLAVVVCGLLLAGYRMPSELTRCWAWTLVWCFSLSLVQTQVSGSQIWNAGLAVGPSLSASLVALYTMARGDGPRREFTGSQHALLACSLGVFCILMTTNNLRRLQALQYREAPTEEQTAVFEIAPLRGIRSTPLTVENMEELARSVAQWTRPGDFVLDYSATPLIFFMTGTRSALPLMWSAPEHGKKLAERQVEWIKGHDRKPVCCIMTTWGNNMVEEDAMMRYIRENFQKDRQIGEFEVWVRPGATSRTRPLRP